MIPPVTCATKTWVTKGTRLQRDRNQMMIDIREVEDGTVLSVRVQPNAGRTRVSGEHAGRIKVAVTVPPEKGKANLAVIRVLAKWLGVKSSGISIISGKRSRDKEVFVRNISKKDVHDSVSQLLD